MSRARDFAADLLLAYDRRPAFVRADLETSRARLSDPRDRALLTELVYGPIRRRGTLDAILSRFSRRPLGGLNAAVRTALRLGLYQVLFLDRVPAHAAVDHAVTWTRGRGGAARAGFVNGVLRGALRSLEGRATGQEQPRNDVPREDGSRLRFGRVMFADPDKRLARHLGERWSAPEWLVARWLEAFGEDRTCDVLRASIARPGLGVRARKDGKALLASLRERGVAAEAGPVNNSILLAGGEGGILEDVAADVAAIQDATSQRVAPLLRLEPGMRVLDLCAAPGGKTLHIADLMGTGHIVACDVDDEKVAALAALDARAGEVTIEACRIEPQGPLPFEPRSFDAVLVDAPCTNTGVLRRRVEARWRLTPDDVQALALLQRDLVERALPLVREGGVLVYSTCSLEREENEGVLDGLEHEVAFRVFPGGDRDGGFAATVRPTT